MSLLRLPSLCAALMKRIISFVPKEVRVARRTITSCSWRTSYLAAKILTLFAIYALTLTIILFNLRILLASRKKVQSNHPRAPLIFFQTKYLNFYQSGINLLYYAIIIIIIIIMILLLLPIFCKLNFATSNTTFKKVVT